ncbi:hypothetical protein ACFFGT_09880 [Mucilaginibacter angelicae]|uniref:Uncharacterized protein n=1 Tax=Mucilaginibacter angelicae TaxID=869718 RepID=A0ABV6L4W3_9SPHI
MEPLALLYRMSTTVIPEGTAKALQFFYADGCWNSVPFKLAVALNAGIVYDRRGRKSPCFTMLVGIY